MLDLNDRTKVINAHGNLIVTQVNITMYNQ